MKDAIGKFGNNNVLSTAQSDGGIMYDTVLTCLEVCTVTLFLCVLCFVCFLFCMFLVLVHNATSANTRYNFCKTEMG